MKKFTKLFAALGAVAMLGLGVFTSCHHDDGDDDVAVSGISLTKDGSEITEISLTKGESVEITATVAPNNATNKKISVVSADSAKVTVSPAEISSSETVTVTAADVTDADSPVTLTFTPLGGKNHAKTVSVTVTEATDQPAAATLTGIEVTTKPTTVAYVKDSAKPDWAGLVVSKVYSDGSKEALSANDYDITGWNSGTAGDITLTVTIKESATESDTKADGFTNTATFTIKITETEAEADEHNENAAKDAETLDKIEVTVSGTAEFTTDSTLDDVKAALTVVPVMKNGDKKEAVEDYTLSLLAADLATAGEKTFTVTYSEVTSDSVKITVNAPSIYDLTKLGTNADGAITGEINLGYGVAYEGTSTVKGEASKKEYTISDGADKLAYVKVTNGNNVWAVKNFGTEADSKEIEALELKSGRSFAVDVKNVSAFEVIAFTTDITRKIAVKVDSGDLVEYAAETASVPFSTGLIITGSTGNHTITITNKTSNTVYAGYIKLYNEAAALAGVKAQWESLLAGYTGDNEAKGKADYYWQGGEAVASAVAKTPSTFDDYAAAITALNTAAANAVVYVKPTAITVKTKDTDKEIETGTPYEHSRRASETLELVASENEGATGKLTWSLTDAGNTGAQLEAADDGASATLKNLTATGTVTITVSDTDSRASGLNKVITINVTAEEVKVAANDEITVTADKTATGIDSKITLSATPAKNYTEETTGKWYKKVGAGEEAEISLTDGVYTTVVADIGSVVFIYKLTGAEATATASTEAVSVNFHVTKAGTVWNVADYVGTSTSLSADTHDIGGVSYKSNASTNIVADTCTDGDRSFTKCIQTGGTGSTTNRVFSFYVDAAAKISVYCKTGGSGERKIVLNNVEQAAPSTAGKLDFEVNAAGTYTMYASTSCYIYGMYVSATSDIKFTAASQDIGQGKDFDVKTLLTNTGSNTETYELADGTANGITISGSTVSVAGTVDVGTTATVIATAGEDTAQLTIKVVEYVPVDKVAFVDKDGKEITEIAVAVGGTLTLADYIRVTASEEGKTPTNTAVTYAFKTGATNTNITLKDGVVSVSDAATANSDTATIVATSADNNQKTAELKITTVDKGASVNYVAAGTYNLTNTAVEGQTQVTTTNAEELGFYVVFQDVKYTNKKGEQTQAAGKFASDGFNSQTKVAEAEGDTGTNGIITFSIKESMTLKLTDSNGKGFAVVSTNGSKSITSGETSTEKFTSGGSNEEQTLTLLAGQYKLYGNTSGGSCKIASLKFEKVSE